MNLPEPQSVTFTSLFAEITDGTIKIPQFQRDFVWTRAQSAKLLDSVVKGYPIGTFILWKTNERLRSIRNLGNVDLPDTPEGDAVKYVLDGQQRMTSLYVTLNGLTIRREERDEHYSQMWVDLAADEDSEIVTLDGTGRAAGECIVLKDLLTGKLQYLAAFPEEYQEKIQAYKTRITSYQFSVVLIKDAPLDVATEIFTRLNVGGKALTPFEIMVAKTYDAKTGFDLAEKVDALLEKLAEVNYDTVSESVILQTIAVFVAGDCRKKVILRLTKKQVLDAWPEVEEALTSAVEYLRGYYRIPVSRLLPYAALLIPFAYFFRNHPDKPSGDRQKYLEDFFWRASFGGRYSQSLESRMAQDIHKIDKILKGKLPKYEWSVDITADFIEENGYFSVSRAFIKALLCILTYQQPKSFNDNAVVHLDNGWLKQANSKNYHHFFPRAWLAKQGEEDFYINHIANITLVDDYLNKRLIQAKAPGQYMKAFSKENGAIEACMATHLIKLSAGWGVMENDYDAFYQKRCAAFSRELKKRIIVQESDGKIAPTPANETVDASEGFGDVDG